MDPVSDTVPAPPAGYLLSVRPVDGVDLLRIAVTATGATGPAGYPVFRDAGGGVVVEISPSGRCRSLTHRGVRPTEVRAFGTVGSAPAL
ncbi:DUF6296 family protein [Kitasatospora sp. NPDC048365]|uniref:DUF6296 family protein n=1 Tax=Kitasatospora sp. NPDC048365 TaxID=3364050 RepID=UPI003715CCFE